MTGIQSEMISYPGRASQIQAYVSRPAGNEPRPALILIHEIFGLVDHTKAVADRFANQGYAVLAPHLFSTPDLVEFMTPQNIRAAMQISRDLGSEKMADPAAVQQEMAKLPEDDQAQVQKVFPRLFGPGAGEHRKGYYGDLIKAVDFLNEQKYVVKGKIASLGFCFGGGLSIQLACLADLAACVVFYGQNPSPIELVKNIPCPVLGLYGAEDLRINHDLDKLVKEMTENKIDFEMRIYPGAGHAFFNDTNPTTYRPAAAREAWDRVLRFFQRALLTSD